MAIRKDNGFLKAIFYLLATLAFLLFSPAATAKNQLVDLTISYKTVNIAGKAVQAMAINDQIPGPTLHFKEGDHVTINVHNQLNTGTTIHWHGLLLPWQMDGVEDVTQHPIPPGGVFHYQFTLKQSGTYWYHSHAGFQEQAGVYGAFVIDPARPSHYRYNKDYAIVLSDWSNTDPNQIYANLKKEGDYYSPRFPLQPSLVRFIRNYQKATPQQRRQVLDDYKMMQQMRMSIYDISDVAYDTFLLNGQPPNQPWTARVKVGDTVRLRFIGANAGSMSHIKIPGATMQMVHVQGHDVRPYSVKDFFIAPGETYDVLVKITKHTPYVIYAASTDAVGAAYGALITAPEQAVDYQRVKPFPEPLPVTREMMTYAMPNDSGHAHGMADMPGMSAPSTAMSGMNMTAQEKDSAATTTSPGTKYQQMVSPVKTNDPNKPVHIINMALSCYMDRFIWFINGLPEYQAAPIILQPGERYRIIFRNDSMMHHPMHIHGHFFILRNGHGAYDPFLHTIDVPPGATVVADFDANADGGQWFFHCHFLYHMMSGMSRVFQYSTLLPEAEQAKAQSHYAPSNSNQIQPDNISFITHPMGHHMGLYRASMLDIGADLFNNAQKLTFKTFMGSDYHKLELNMEDAQLQRGVVESADLDVFYWHLISEFWALKGGANYVYRPAERAYLQPGVGIEGLMPYFINTDIRGYYHNASGKFDIQLSRDTQITDRFFLRTGVRGIFATKTVEADDVGSGLNQLRYIARPYYRLTPSTSLFLEYEHEDAYGAYAGQLTAAGEGSSQNTYTIGLAFLF